MRSPCCLYMYPPLTIFERLYRSSINSVSMSCHPSSSQRRTAWIPLIGSIKTAASQIIIYNVVLLTSLLVRTKVFFFPTFNIYSNCSEREVCNYFFPELLALFCKVVFKNYVAFTIYLVSILKYINEIFLKFRWLCGYCQTVIFLLMCFYRYSILRQRDYNRTDWATLRKLH
jgi:hypothetical protein